jgi:hypothetical protein
MLIFIVEYQVDSFNHADRCEKTNYIYKIIPSSYINFWSTIKQSPKEGGNHNLLISVKTLLLLDLKLCLPRWFGSIIQSCSVRISLYT